MTGAEEDGRLPVSVLVGFLGSGKTTLLNRLLFEQHERKLAVIVNDFGEVGIDAGLVRHATERTVEMANGCICCTLREDLLQELRALAALPDLDAVLVESTGIGSPMPIAQTFYMEDLPELVRLDSVVTVVDSSKFWQDYVREDLIEDAEGNEVMSPLAPLLVEQLEFTNVVLLNKADKAAAEELDRLESFVRALNPSARLYRSVFGEVDPALILDTGLYDYEAGMTAEGWEEAWEQENVKGEADEFGFTSFVYRQERPLDWRTFLGLFEGWPPAVLRAKGFVAFADHNPVLLSLAGQDLSLEELAQAGKLSPEAAAALSLEELHAYREAWEAQGPAKADAGPTELVFIGRGMDEAELRRMLDGCIAKKAALT